MNFGNLPPDRPEMQYNTVAPPPNISLSLAILPEIQTLET